MIQTCKTRFLFIFFLIFQGPFLVLNSLFTFQFTFFSVLHNLYGFTYYGFEGVEVLKVLKLHSFRVQMCA